MVRRHPHVFGEESVSGADEQQRRWEEIKAQEKGDRATGGSLLDDVPVGLPALTRAVKLGKRAARIGFDWPDATGPRAKVNEELAELDEALQGADRAAVEAEFGDVLLALANLARHLDLDPEAALRAANGRFTRRFHAVEAHHRAHAGADLAALEAAWQRAKQHDADAS